jgi:hypothetical protein
MSKEKVVGHWQVRSMLLDRASDDDDPRPRLVRQLRDPAWYPSRQVAR